MKSYQRLAGVQDFGFEAAFVAVSEYVASAFTHLLHEISDTLLQIQKEDGTDKEYPLGAALEATKNTLIQGSIKLLLCRISVLGLILKLRDMMIGWIREGFQRFFRRLNDELLLLSGQNVNETGSLLSLSGGGYAFDPAQVCHTFRAVGERLLQHLSKLIEASFTVCKYENPKDFCSFEEEADNTELGQVGREVKQILGEGGWVVRKHARTEKNGRTSSSRNNTNNNNRSNTNMARSQLLETHLAKLFKQKMEIFTKVQHTQGFVVMSIVKLYLKSFQEFVRLQTFNRSGFQQIQLDVQYLKTTLKDTTDSEDEAALEFLLDEVIVAAAERCLDLSPLEPDILDRLVQLKLAR
ncbi:unnamed protein product [Lactuca saligna]|uniref:Vacuolar protein sorting-associated protein 51 homolog n=1 Tax=Lactuca saligna TaxID=75948 RepID=A0AA35ZM24_LACSI|nr:unnamed protein product [Lactuca saligna]